MQRYRYKLLDANQKPKSGQINAKSREAAIQQLSKKGCTVTELEPLVGGVALPAGVRKYFPLILIGIVLAVVCVLVVPGWVAGQRVKTQRQQAQLVELLKKGDVGGLSGELKTRGYDLNTPLEDGTYLLHFAAEVGRPEVVKLFLDQGADPNVADVHQSSPLHLATLLEETEVTLMLLQAGAVPVAEDVYGNTPLHWASEWGRTAQVEVLLEHGVSPDLKNQAGETPVHLAVESGDVEILKLLIEAGGQVNGVDENQQSPLHRAASYEDRTSLAILVEHGGDLRLRDAEGKRPVDLAEEQSTKDLVTP